MKEIEYIEYLIDLKILTNFLKIICILVFMVLIIYLCRSEKKKTTHEINLNKIKETIKKEVNFVPNNSNNNYTILLNPDNLLFNFLLDYVY